LAEGLNIGGSGPAIVMRGQKRVKDARERAYDPRIHPLRKNFTKMDGLPGQGPAMTEDGIASAH
jgi:hypothetical protein